MAVTNVSFEMNDKLKNQMEEICEDLGMSMDDAFQIFARKMVNEEGLPFEVTEADYPVDEKEEKLKKACAIAAATAAVCALIALIVRLFHKKEEKKEERHFWF